MIMFDAGTLELEGWVIVHSNNQLTAYGPTPRRTQRFILGEIVCGEDIAWTVQQLG